MALEQCHRRSLYDCEAGPLDLADSRSDGDDFSATQVDMWFLIALILLFIALIAMVAYGGYENALKKLKEATRSATNAEECKEKACGRKCQRPKSKSCNRCGHMPCKCAHILPDQKKCPICPGDLKRSEAGMGTCNRCHRSYRCPGCQLN